MSDQIPAGFVPFDDIPDSGVLPDGAYQVRGEELRNEVTSTGKKMYSMQAVVELPEQQAGMFVFENFVIGSEGDPQALQKDTWLKSIGARRWKQMMKAAQVPQTTNEAQVLAGFAGSVFTVVATTYTEKDGDYAGTQRNRFNFYRVGTYAPGLAAKGAPKGAGARPAGPAAAAMAAPAVQPVAPAPAYVPPPQPQPQYAQAPQPAPRPTMPPPVAQPAPQGAPPQVVMLPCGNCGKSFTVAEFPGHVQLCLQGKA